ncbi:MAG: Hpt domain-containing protein [Lachnospiraceae bacterium]|jgi:HPt (histidine-containing phosphotransfer) domain-containing protein|nr:Hpt domain-containing protein [Lachnospiraceae bacterium]
MTADEKQKLEAGGVNVEEAMQRFMNNEKLLERFLKKFVVDGSYNDLVKAIEEKDCDKAFTQAHTLKGVTGNLALAKLHDLVNRQTDHLRGKEFDTAAAMMAEVTKAYEEVIGAIKGVYGE